jgi:outer membrane protein assembly factor BamC
MFLFRSVFKKILLFFFIANLSACSFFVGEDGIFRDRKKDYRKAESLPRIEVPANLDDQAIVDFYPVPPVSRFSDGEMIDVFPLPIGVVNTDAAVKIQSIEKERWILIQASASQIWPRLKEFLAGQSLALMAENGAAGMMEARADTGVYRFHVEQGFQRNTSEISIRFLDNPSSVAAFWPEFSSDIQKEQVMLEHVAQFFANASAKPSYSFAAQGISTQKKIDIEHDASGNKTLVLLVNQQRAWLTLNQSLVKANFTIKNTNVENKQFLVQYTPPLSPDEQPGAFWRFFGFKLKPYDEDIQYAGEHYEFQLGGNDDHARIQIKALDIEDQNTDDIRKEQNQVLLILKERLY